MPDGAVPRGAAVPGRPPFPGGPPLPAGTPGPPRGMLVAAAHGSADPRAAAVTGDLMAVAARRAAARGLGVPCLRAAYLGHARPSLARLLGTLRPGEQVTVLPLLLTAAYHSKTDIPRVLARFPWLRVRYGGTLGPHPLLLRALERGLLAQPGAAAAGREQTGIVLAAAGSSDPEANVTVARLAARWQSEGGWFAVRPGYASAGQPSGAEVPPGFPGPPRAEVPPGFPGPPRAEVPPGSPGPPRAAVPHGPPIPSPAAAVAGLLRDGARRVLVASYLLAPGTFADRIRRSCLAAGAAAVGPPLGAAPEVADVLLDRYAEACSAGTAAA
jgi:sirohydrochlorin ferrochelatase